MEGKTMAEAMSDVLEAWQEFVMAVGEALGMDKLLNWLADRLR